MRTIAYRFWFTQSYRYQNGFHILGDAMEPTNLFIDEQVHNQWDKMIRICKIFSHWLLLCLTIDRKRASLCLKENKAHQIHSSIHVLIAIGTIVIFSLFVGQILNNDTTCGNSFFFYPSPQLRYTPKDLSTWMSWYVIVCFTVRERTW